MIEGIAGEFRRGRLVRIEAAAEDDREFLAAYLARDRGAGRLGELALVDSSSRVGAAGRPYFTTLLDENAAAHIAFGLGFGDTREPGAQAVNRSGIHLDVMIGAPEMDVEAVDARGRNVTLISGGLFAGGPLAGLHRDAPWHSPPSSGCSLECSACSTARPTSATCCAGRRSRIAAPG